MRTFGLIGKKLTHSFSPGYFAEKFIREGISDAEYRLFEMPDVSGLRKLFIENPDLVGVNITIPFKQDVISVLDELSDEAEKIGAVNTVKAYRKGISNSQHLILKGFNTDVYGFRESVKQLIRPYFERALILGTGGSSLAVSHVLRELGIQVLQVSRTPTEKNQIGWNELNRNVVEFHPFIINTTPVGQYPDIEKKPDFPFEFLGPHHVLYDLIYNPEETMFLRLGKEKGAQIQNGYTMLINQAEKSWSIWNAGD